MRSYSGNDRPPRLGGGLSSLETHHGHQTPGAADLLLYTVDRQCACYRSWPRCIQTTTTSAKKQCLACPKLHRTFVALCRVDVLEEDHQADVSGSGERTMRPLLHGQSDGQGYPLVLKFEARETSAAITRTGK
jgi:hypothetical protein